MRTLLFTLLLAILGISEAGAQRSLPPSLRPYASRWTPQLRDMFVQAGFTLPDQVGTTSPGLDRLPRSQHLKLDSTIQFVAYPDSMPVTRQRFTYPHPLVDVEITSTYQGGEWLHEGQIARYVDGMGRTTDVVAWNYDPVTEEFVPDSWLLNFLRGDSPTQLDSAIVLAWNTEIGDYERLLDITWIYDEEDRVEWEITSMLFFEIPFYFRDHYTYDEQGRLETIESINDDGQAQWPAGFEAFEYNEVDQVAASTVFAYSPIGGFIPQDRTEYRYTAHGAVDTVRTLAWDIHNELWLELRLDDYDHDAEQRVIRHTALIAEDEGPGQRLRTLFAYVEDQYLLVEGAWAWDNDLPGWALQSKTWYFYEELLSATPEPGPGPQDLAMWPNPGNGLVRLELPEGEHQLRVFSTSGQLMGQVTLTGGSQTVDLTGLPAGLYQVLANGSAGRYLGRLVIQ